MRLFIVVALAAATFGFAADRKHRQNDPLDQATRGAITTSSQLSFTNPSRLRSAFDAVQSKEPAAKTLLSLNVSATEIHGTLLGRDGQEFYMSVDASLKPTVRSTDSGTDSAGLPLSKVPFNAASRILNAARGKFKLDPANLTSLTFSAFAIGDSLGNWNASYRRPFTHNSIQAAFDGTDVRLSGTPDAAARKQMAAAQKQIATAQTNATKQLRDARKRIAAAKARARKALAGLN